MSFNQGMIGPQMPLDPMRNNQPLQFNTNKGKPPMPVEGDMDRNDPYPDSSTSGDMMGGGGGGMFGGPGMGDMGFSGGNMMQGNMMGSDPSMMMMFNQFGNMGAGGPNLGSGGPWLNQNIINPIFLPKEIITLKSSVLYPPPPNAAPPTTRERPPGCRTAFVGGLPENVTEDMILEIFENFGVICSIRKGKKNFCHIRFELEESVDRSLYISGYRMKIEDKDDKPNTGRLHVDYAMARDDQYEFECKQRMMAREMRHRQRIEEERIRPPSPPPIVHFSDHEANNLMDRLKSEDGFMKASLVLLTWLERGDLTKRNVNVFYSMVQCTNSQVRRLMAEKQQHEEELMKMKENFKKIFEGILHQFDQIEKVFSLAHKQRNWDHFSKAQRKNIELWFRQAQEIKKSQQDEYLSERVDDDMEMSDGEDGPTPAKKGKPLEAFNQSQLDAYMEKHNLREENDSLKCQVEAYKNEIEMVKHENNASLKEKESQLKLLQQAMQGMQQQLIQSKAEVKELEKKMSTLKTTDFQEKKGEETEVAEDKTETDAEKTDTDILSKPSPAKEVSAPIVSSSGMTLTEKQARLIGLISCFLHVHPNGASVDYIWSYLHQMNVQVRTSELEDLLERLPILYQQVLSGVGATIEKRWKFVAYSGTSAPSIGLS